MLFPKILHNIVKYRVTDYCASFAITKKEKCQKKEGEAEEIRAWDFFYGGGKLLLLDSIIPLSGFVALSQITAALWGFSLKESVISEQKFSLSMLIFSSV